MVNANQRLLGNTCSATFDDLESLGLIMPTRLCIHLFMTIIIVPRALIFIDDLVSQLQLVVLVDIRRNSTVVITGRATRLVVLIVCATRTRYGSAERWMVLRVAVDCNIEGPIASNGAAEDKMRDLKIVLAGTGSQRRGIG